MRGALLRQRPAMQARRCEKPRKIIEPSKFECRSKFELSDTIETFDNLKEHVAASNFDFRIYPLPRQLEVDDEVVVVHFARLALVEQAVDLV